MPSSFEALPKWSPAELDGCHESVAAIHAYWRAKCGQRSMPARRDIDPIEMKSVLPQLILVDVVPDERRYVYRLVGTYEVEMRGADPTGKAIKDAYYAESADHTMHFLDRVVETRQPVLYRGTYQPSRTRTQEDDIIYLPLSNDDANVNMILIYGHTRWVRDERST